MGGGWVLWRLLLLLPLAAAAVAVAVVVQVQVELLGHLMVGPPRHLNLPSPCLFSPTLLGPPPPPLLLESSLLPPLALAVAKLPLSLRG